MTLKKRGSHVGVFLSFVVFVTFLIFLYSIIEPKLEKDKEKKFILENLKKEIVDLNSAELIKVTITHEEDAGGMYGCLKVGNGAAGISNMNAISKDAEERIINSGFDADSLIINWENNERAFFKIYYSEFFPDSFKQEGDCSIPDISLVQANKYLFEKKIDEYIKYRTFSSLDIPASIRFYFSFEDAEGEIKRSGEDVKDASTAIYADRFAVQYVNDRAEIKTGFINIKVW